MRNLRLYLLLLSIGFSSVLSGQNFWKTAPADPLPQPQKGLESLRPSRFDAFQLDYAAMASFLKTAPMEFTEAARTQPLLLNLPGKGGTTQQFLVRESPVMAPELMAKYPEIRTYSGIAADGSGTVIRLGTGYKGFYAYLFVSDGSVRVIRPAVADRPDLPYLAYDQADLPVDQSMASVMRCGVADTPDSGHPIETSYWKAHAAADRNQDPVSLRKYRIAIAAKAEYSIFHGGTKPLVMSAIVEALNFIVAIQERDFAVRMELIPNNDTMIFFDPATDPYTGNLDSWITQNHIAMNNILGAANYDIGHVFGVAIAGEPIVGLAQTPSVCSLFAKGRGGSSLDPPTGVAFYMVAAHEMCHQMSGTHSWNNCPPAQDQLAPGTAYEPGSGSTIMSYAGSCGASNVLNNNNTEQYYHTISIEQVRTHVFTGDGAGCGTLMATDNNEPSASIPLSNGFYIPISTPFQLTGQGSDPENDPLTYCWEEFDLGPSSPLGQPSGTSPLFRSFFPSDSPSRSFPRLSVIAANQTNQSEYLPTTSRVLTFRMTVRDNHPGGGGVAVAQVNFNSTTEAGPFLVTYPNTNGQVWDAGTYQTVTWNVANTDKAPVNCQTVNIRLSTDGGLTYPLTLASGVPNSGRYCILVPDSLTLKGRVRVEAADNIFFDISNTNLKIQQAQQAGYTLCTGTSSSNLCLPEPFSTVLSTSSSLSFNTPINLSVSGLPVGATATFSQNPVQPGSNTTLTVNFAANTPEAVYDLAIQGDAGGSLSSSLISLTVISNNFSAFALQTPANGASGVDLGPVLYWNAVTDANAYELQLATSPSFAPGTIVFVKDNITTDSLKSPVLLMEGQAYYWRMRPVNGCNNANWSEPFVFITTVQSCATLAATDLPKNISANSTPTVESKITVTTGGLLSDVNVKSVAGNHNFFKDLEAHLISPAGTDVLLWKDKCPGTFNFNIKFDDAVSTQFTCPPQTNAAGIQPATPLSALIGQAAAGVWTLRIKDNTIGSGGQLTGFELELCSNTALNAPFIVNNNVLQLVPGDNAPLSTSLLKTDDANNSAAQLKYTIITIPQNGLLQYNGTSIQPGDQFTQSAIDGGLVRYFDYGLNAGTDDFRFAVTDGEGGLVTGTFIIEPFPVGTKDPARSLTFSLAPNPADETIHVSFPEKQPVDTRIILYNTAGQQLRSWIAPAGTLGMTLQIADLPDGVYAIALQNERGRGVKKVVIR